MEDTEAPFQSTPRYMQDLHRGRASFFCVNGDFHTGSKKVVYHPRQIRDFSHYLDFLTDKLRPPFGAVRKICTPGHGHRIRSLEDLQADMTYVAAGPENFKFYSYAQIDPTPKKGGPRIYDVEPGHNRRYQVSARCHKIDATSKIIRCWKNGDDMNKPNVVALPTRYCHTVDDVLDLVSQVMQKIYVFGPVSKLYLPSGEKVSDIDQIFNNTYFVALRRSDHFKKVNYKEVALTNFSFSPRGERWAQLPPLPRSNKTSSQSSPEHSTSSNNGYRREHNRVRKEEEQVFPARPIKHKRSSEKVRQVDYDEDSGGVFKAKTQNRATKGARPVEETRHTRTDLPVDQRPAEEVQEDEDHVDDRETWAGGDTEKEKVKGGLSKDNQKKKEESQERTYRTNARRQQQAGEEDPARRQAQQEAENEARARREAEDRERLERNKRQQAAMQQRKEEERRKKEEEEERKRKEDEKRREEEKKPQDSVQKNKEQPATDQQPAKSGPQNNKVEDEDEHLQDHETPLPVDTPVQDYDNAGTNLDHLEEERRRKENLAATKIQAGYRGYRTRKQLRQKRAEEEESLEQDPSLMQDEPIPLGDSDSLADPDQNVDQKAHAATTIQSGFRGYKARQEVQRMKEDEKSRKEG